MTNWTAAFTSCTDLACLFSAPNDVSFGIWGIGIWGLTWVLLFVAMLAFTWTRENSEMEAAMVSSLIMIVPTLYMTILGWISAAFNIFPMAMAVVMFLVVAWRNK